VLPIGDNNGISIGDNNGIGIGDNIGIDMGESSLPPLISIRTEVSLDSLLLHSFHVQHLPIPIPMLSPMLIPMLSPMLIPMLSPMLIPLVSHMPIRILMSVLERFTKFRNASFRRCPRGEI
jgi:hypothetical protein